MRTKGVAAGAWRGTRLALELGMFAASRSRKVVQITPLATIPSVALASDSREPLQPNEVDAALTDHPLTRLSKVRAGSISTSESTPSNALTWSGRP